MGCPEGSNDATNTAALRGAVFESPQLNWANVALSAKRRRPSGGGYGAPFSRALGPSRKNANAHRAFAFATTPKEDRHPGRGFDGASKYKNEVTYVT